MFNKIKSWYKNMNINLFSNSKTNSSTKLGINLDVTVSTQSTPNPNAKKFILNTPVKENGKVSYEEASKCDHIPLAKSLFQVPGMKRVHFSGEFITITKNLLT